MTSRLTRIECIATHHGCPSRCRQIVHMNGWIPDNSECLTRATVTVAMVVRARLPVSAYLSPERGSRPQKPPAGPCRSTRSNRRRAKAVRDTDRAGGRPVRAASRYPLSCANRPAREPRRAMPVGRRSVRRRLPNVGFLIGARRTDDFRHRRPWDGWLCTEQATTGMGGLPKMESHGVVSVLGPFGLLASLAGL
jgi:hypothetical protein